MPTWAWILVTLAGAAGSGLLGTFARISHDRRADTRRRMMDEIEAFAGSATDWFDAVRAAMEQRMGHLLEGGDSQPPYDTAAAAVQDGRRKANRLQVVVPYGSDLGQCADAVIGCLEGALAELEDWPPQAEDEDELTEEDRADSVTAPMEDAYAEAELLHRVGLGAFGEFIELAAIETHRSYLPIRRMVVRTVTALPRMAKRQRRHRRHAREQEAMKRLREERRAKSDV